MQTKIFKQHFPSSRWEIPVPTTRSFVLGVYDRFGRIIPHYEYTIDNNFLSIDFGFDEYKGEAIIGYVETQQDIEALEFVDATEIYIPLKSYTGNVELLRDNQYIPVIMNPEYINHLTLKFTFTSPESGRIY